MLCPAISSVMLSSVCYRCMYNRLLCYSWICRDAAHTYKQFHWKVKPAGYEQIWSANRGKVL